MIVFNKHVLRVYLLSCSLLAVVVFSCSEQPVKTNERAALADAQGYILNEQYEQAESTLVALATHSSLSGEGHFLMGQAKVGLFDDEGAIEHFRSSLDLDSERLNTRLQLVKTLRRIGLHDEAFEEVEKVAWQDYAPLLYEVGQIRMQAGDFAKAIDHFERVLTLDPGFYEGYYGLGTAYQRVGRGEEAEEMLARYQGLYEAAEDVKLDAQIVDLNPESADAHYNLARAYERHGEDELAILSYQKAISLDGAMREAYNNLGIVYFRLNEDEKAVKAFEQAISISDTTAKYYFNLGAVYARRGVLTEAEKLWRKTLELDPDYQKAKEFLRQIEQAGS